MATQGSRLTIGVGRHMPDSGVTHKAVEETTLRSHERRKQALHEIFDQQTGVLVADWGRTDDTEPHEYVELVLEIVSRPEVVAAALPVVVYIGGIVSNAAGSLLADAVKALLPKLRAKQQEKDVQSVHIFVPGGIRLIIVPQGTGARVTVDTGKASVEVDYDASESELPPPQIAGSS